MLSLLINAIIYLPLVLSPGTPEPSPEPLVGEAVSTTLPEPGYWGELSEPNGWVTMHSPGGGSVTVTERHFVSRVVLYARLDWGDYGEFVTEFDGDSVYVTLYPDEDTEELELLSFKVDELYTLFGW